MLLNMTDLYSYKHSCKSADFANCSCVFFRVQHAQCYMVQKFITPLCGCYWCLSSLFETSLMGTCCTCTHLSWLLPILFCHCCSVPAEPQESGVCRSSVHHEAEDGAAEGGAGAHGAAERGEQLTLISVREKKRATRTL